LFTQINTKAWRILVHAFVIFFDFFK